MDSAADNLWDTLVGDLRSDLGQDSFESAYREGKALSWDEAIRLALSVPPTNTNHGQQN